MLNRRTDYHRVLSTIFILMLATVGAIDVVAQEFPYSMTVSTAPYVTLPAYQIEVPEEDIATQQLRLPAGISMPAFEFLGTPIDSIIAFSNGAVALYSQGMWRGQLNALVTDHVIRASAVPSDHSSAFGATVDGAVGSRILKIEWKSLTVPSDLPDDGLDSINYQVWLHEGSNTVEVRVGPSSVSTGFTNFGEPTTGPALQLFDPMNINGIFFAGNPAAPTRHIYPTDPFADLQGFPAEGTVYRFTAGSSSVGAELHARATGVTAAPNPASEFTMIRFALEKSADCELLLFDALGAEYLRLDLGRLTGGQQSIRLGTDKVPPGIYFYTISADGVGVTREIVVAR